VYHLKCLTLAINWRMGDDPRMSSIVRITMGVGNMNELVSFGEPSQGTENMSGVSLI